MGSLYLWLYCLVLSHARRKLCAQVNEICRSGSKPEVGRFKIVHLLYEETTWENLTLALEQFHTYWTKPVQSQRYDHDDELGTQSRECAVPRISIIPGPRWPSRWSRVCSRQYCPAEPSHLYSCAATSCTLVPLPHPPHLHHNTELWLVRFIRYCAVIG